MMKIASRRIIVATTGKLALYACFDSSLLLHDTYTKGDNSKKLMLLMIHKVYVNHKQHAFLSQSTLVLLLAQQG